MFLVLLLSVVSLTKVTSDEPNETIIGETKVRLDGASCRRIECNLGDFIAESMALELSINYAPLKNSEGNIAFIQGKRIGRSIPEGANLTLNNIKEILPIEEPLFVVRLFGKAIRDALLRSFEGFSFTKGSEQFLQFHGLRVHYDFARSNPEDRLVSVQVDCGLPNCLPKELENPEIYSVVIGSHLLSGGDGFKSFTNHIGSPLELMITDRETLEDHIRRLSSISPRTEGRIRIDNIHLAGSCAIGLTRANAILLTIISSIHVNSLQ